MEQGDSAAFINGRCHRVLTGHTDYVLSVAYQHPYIITGSLDQTIRLWSTNGDLKAAFPFSYDAPPPTHIHTRTHTHTHTETFSVLKNCYHNQSTSAVCECQLRLDRRG